MKTRTFPVVHELVSTRLPNRFGDFIIHCYGGAQDGKQHLALVKGEVRGREGVLARVHSECLTGDVFGSRRCDCGEQLELALRAIGEAECGVLLYLRQEGRGIGLVQKLRAYNLQDEGLDTVEANLRLGHQADERDYHVAARMLEDLGVKSVRLMTNNPKKIDELRRYGIPIAARVPIEAPSHPENVRYLRAKVEKMSHMLSFERKRPRFPFLDALCEHQSEGPVSPRRPFVTLSRVQSLDGGDAPTAGAEACELAGALRAVHEGTLTASGPALRLTVRGGRKAPVNFAMAGTPSAVGDVVAIPADARGDIDLAAVLATILGLGVRTLLVEGDAGLSGRFLDQALADYCVITVVPEFQGGSGSGSGGIGRGASRIAASGCQTLGRDLVVYGSLRSERSETPAVLPSD
ncbi:GTP cyclohydrolase II [Methylococcus capsulatus]|jgi:3,4-dihydroxy 2-butanone 4-phosphate synthase/GTP cyclohydrolase II|uniref:GTP cyclohydrolase II n=1 Tax=Methylococcus capsulatus TaxID=414 RepID=UPI0002E17A30